MENTISSVIAGTVFPVSNIVLLPGIITMIHLAQTEDLLMRYPESVDSVNIALPLRANFAQKRLEEEDFYRVGVSFSITDTERTEKGVFLKIKVHDRVEVSRIRFEGEVILAEYTHSPEKIDMDEKSRTDMLGYLKNIVSDISEKFRGGEQYRKIADKFRDINAFIAYLSQFMPISAEEKYEFLKIESLKERSLRFMDCLLKQKESIELNMQINERLSEKTNKSYREAMLREQLKLIQDELNEGKTGSSKKEKDYLAMIEESFMPDEIKQAAIEEYEKLEAQGQNGPEQNVIRNYLEFMLQLPWKKEEQKPVDLHEAKRILNERHYGLEKVKERILQHLAVMRLKNDKKGSILMLVGPPGTGKTSLGKSVAEALGRHYIRLSLGGIRDEAEIRGHRRTYVGALPGRILQSIKKAGSSNPVLVLDEVDKLMAGGFSGDPSSALLEVLDPEQNNTFTDHYLDLPYDLSDVFFIATANTTETIPAPLLDRMEIIQISGYTSDEKFHIGKDHLLPSVLEDHGLTADRLSIDDEVLRRIIADYTLEAGVRGLKKQLAAIARAAAQKIVSDEVHLPYIARSDELDELLGRQVSHHERAQLDNPPGVVTGLAWTPVGGEILFIEVAAMPGNGEITLTGKLGDVMKESARISLSLLKSRLPLAAMNYKERDLHIHVPSGAVPKDGPSAGIALFTALSSLVTGIKVDPRIAMTGEVTLRGAVLPIGGLKEKLLAAQRAGINKVLIPKDNVADLRDVPAEVKDQMTIIPVQNIEEVLKETLGISLPGIAEIIMNSPEETRSRAS